MHVSFAYGLTLHSELPLMLPTVTEADQPQVVIRLGNLDEEEGKSGQDNQVLLHLPLEVKLLIREGREVIVDASSEIDPMAIRALVLGTGMAFILRQRGFLVLHASCVVKDNQAIAFLGSSGWGKSTLASLFHSHGYQLVADDVMAVQFNVSQPHAIPSFPEVKLLPDAAVAVGAATDTLSTLHALSYKNVQRLNERFATVPVSLKQLYVLRIGEANHIEPLARAQAFTELVQHSRAIKVEMARQHTIQHFQQCSALANQLPMAYLCRPPSLEQLPQLIPFIEAHLQGI
jgi:energy-coupling factor transporter ATP-binding protein EcfA2